MRKRHVEYIHALGRSFAAHHGKNCQGCAAKNDALLCHILPECGKTIIFLESRRNVVMHVKETKNEFDLSSSH